MSWDLPRSNHSGFELCTARRSPSITVCSAGKVGKPTSTDQGHFVAWSFLLDPGGPCVLGTRPISFKGWVGALPGLWWPVGWGKNRREATLNPVDFLGASWPLGTVSKGVSPEADSGSQDQDPEILCPWTATPYGALQARPAPRSLDMLSSSSFVLAPTRPF